jgi:hypothetical protein
VLTCQERCSRDISGAHVTWAVLTWHERCSRGMSGAHVTGAVFTCQERCSRDRSGAHVQGAVLTWWEQRTLLLLLLLLLLLITKATNKMQLYRLIYYSKSALNVSGDVFAHHQEHLTAFTVSGNIYPSSLYFKLSPFYVCCTFSSASCCRLVSWMRSTHPRHQPAATWVNITG